MDCTCPSCWIPCFPFGDRRLHGWMLCEQLRVRYRMYAEHGTSMTREIGAGSPQRHDALDDFLKRRGLAPRLEPPARRCAVRTEYFAKEYAVRTRRTHHGASGRSCTDEAFAEIHHGVGGSPHRSRDPARWTRAVMARTYSRSDASDATGCHASGTWIAATLRGAAASALLRASSRRSATHCTWIALGLWPGTHGPNLG